METNRGKLIVIEGIDGCGKTTQVKMLKNRLSNKDNIHFTREYTDGPIGKLLRYTYLAGLRECDERVINMLYAADRLDHVTNNEDGMINFINNGTNVISDRYYLSSMAYHSYMMHTKDEILDMMHHIIIMNRYVIDMLKPDLTIYIDLDPNVALSRMKSSREDLSVYETSEKLNRIHNTYNIAINILRNKFNENIISVNGNRSIEEIHNDIYTHVCDMLNN